MTDYTELIAKCEELLEIINRLNRSDLNKFISDAADAIERLQKERDAAVAAVHKQCSTCKRVDFCATDAGQPTLWACVSAAKCNWEWRGVQEVEHEAD